MFTLRFTNVQCSAEGETFPSADAAIARGRQCGFEFTVWSEGALVVSWTVFGGLRR